MDEILNLLNKYDSPKTIYSRGTHRWQFFGITNVFVRDGEDGLKWLNPAQLISKEYGFIKRLVDNDKIDIESYCRITSIERKGEKDVYRDEVDSLLMLLAIQDKPIRFLCEILK